MKFPSKKDWWLTIIVWGSMLFTLGSGINIFLTQQLSLGLFVFILILFIFFPIFFYGCG